MPLTDVELWIFNSINGCCGKSYLFDQIVFFFSVSHFVKTIPFVVCIWILWLRPQTTRQHRETLIAMIVAVVVALAITRGLSTFLPFRLRPYLTPDIGFQPPLIGYDFKDNLTDWSSFPSDHATYFFAMTVGFIFISRWLGVLFGLLSVWIVWQRIYLGLHFPGDVMAGALVGIIVAAYFCRPAVSRYVAAPAFGVQRYAPVAFNGLFFVTLFEMGNMFNEVRQVVKGSLIVLKHYGTFLVS